jgi:hypothetical protein
MNTADASISFCNCSALLCPIPYIPLLKIGTLGFELQPDGSPNVSLAHCLLLHQRLAIILAMYLKLVTVKNDHDDYVSIASSTIREASISQDHSRTDTKNL